MNDSDREDLLADLAAGRTSRNRHYARFVDLAARRVLAGHRRMDRIAREAADPRARLEVLRALDGRVRTVRVWRADLGCRWEMTLLDWEADLLARRYRRFSNGGGT